MSQRVVILDRDGTIIADRHYLSDPDGVELLPSAALGLQKLQGLGLRLVLIYQSVRNRPGLFSIQEVNAVNERMTSLLGQQGVKLEGIFVCPHAPEESCECRKPKPWLATLATETLGLSLADAFVIGDKACDIQLGHNIGGITLLILTDDGEQQARNGECRPHFIARDLLEAARLIEKCINGTAQVAASEDPKRSLRQKQNSAKRS